MSRFITVTNRPRPDTRKPVIVNSDHIARIVPEETEADGRWTEITFSRGGDPLIVTETPDEVMRLIADASF